MAEVAPTPGAESDIDYHLSYQFDRWESVPEYASWWHDLDMTQREVFQLEWVGITESRLQALQRRAERGHLTSAQQARYRDLQRLVARHRPTLERLLSE
jgi:hypothetical protein